MENKKSILIVDDEDIFGVILSRLLKDEGYTVSSCSKPSDAITLAQERNFEIILTDYNMPEMNGAELARLMRYRFADSYIIGLSCESRENAFLAAGADIFLDKPIDYRELLALIRQQEHTVAEREVHEMISV